MAPFSLLVAHTQTNSIASLMRHSCSKIFYMGGGEGNGTIPFGSDREACSFTSLPSAWLQIMSSNSLSEKFIKEGEDRT